MQIKKIFATAAVILAIAGVAIADSVYDRYEGVSSANGAATYTFSGDYAAALVKGITVKGAGITNLATASRVTISGTHTQVMSAAVAGTGVAQETILSPYLKSGDKIVIAPNAGNEAATTNYSYMIEFELQRR